MLCYAVGIVIDPSLMGGMSDSRQLQVMRGTLAS